MRLFFLFFFVVVYNVQSQQITVLNEVDGTPVVGAVLYNNAKTKSAVTDIYGKVTIDKFDRNELINFQHVSFHIVSFFKTEINNQSVCYFGILIVFCRLILCKA